MKIKTEWEKSIQFQPKDGKEQRTTTCTNKLSHGSYTSRKTKVGSRDYWTKCPQCRNDRDKADRARDLKEACAVALPEYFKTHDFGDLEPFKLLTDKHKSIYLRVEKYVNNATQALKKCKNLIMIGDPGGGKTHLAKRLIQRLHNQQYNVEYHHFSALMDKIKNTFTRASLRTKEEIIHGLTEFDFLVIDEFSTKTLTETDKELLHVIILKRHDLRKPTCLITNLKHTELAGAMLQPTYDRLADKNSVFIEVDLPSYRRLKEENIDTGSRG